MDRGDGQRVSYLGCAMLTSMATGLGALQKPLRDLYFRHLQAGKGARLPPRWLSTTDSGIHITGQSADDEAFYNMASIMFWDAVQFVTVKGPDKKICGAFEPLDNDHSRNKAKLFTVLDKKYNFLTQLTHPSLFTCVLRRTSGVKALDLHAFICHSDEQALGLVHTLNLVQDNFTCDQVCETGVFGYNPFGKESVRGTPSRAAGVSHSRAFGSTPSLDAIAQSPSNPVVSAAPSPGRPVSRSKSQRQLTQEDFGRPQEVYEYSEHITGSLDRRSTPGQRSSTTGQGYGLLSGSGGALPGYHGSRSKTPPDPVVRPGSPTGYQNTIERVQPRIRPQIPVDNLREQYQKPQLAASRSSQQVASRSPLQLTRTESHATRTPPPTEPKVKDHQRPKSVSRAVLAQPEDPPNRPVAMVPPRKVQGIKVLPSMPQAPLKAVTESSPSSRQGSVRAGSSNRQGSNWHFNTPPKPAPEVQQSSKPEDCSGEGENLLMAQKKDAEIASVFRDLHFDGEPMSPHGTNFENALGYFP